MVLQHSLFGRTGRLNFEAASLEGGSETTAKAEDEAGQKVSPVPLIQWGHVELYGSDTTVASAAVELQGPRQGGRDGKLRLGDGGFTSLAASNLATKSLAERRMAFYRGEREGEDLDPNPSTELNPDPNLKPQPQAQPGDGDADGGEDALPPVAVLAPGDTHVATIRRLRQCFFLHTVQVTATTEALDRLLLEAAELRKLKHPGE